MRHPGLQLVQRADVPILSPQGGLHLRRQGLEILIGRQILVQQVRQAEIVLKGLSHGFLTSTASVSGSLLVHVRKSGDSDEFGHIPGDAVLQAGNCRT